MTRSGHCQCHRGRDSGRRVLVDQPLHKDGYYEKNEFGAYNLNNITAKKSEDGSVAVQFGGCDGKVPNCLPIMKGWNFMVRLYRPHAEILDGTWKFPEAEPAD